MLPTEGGEHIFKKIDKILLYSPFFFQKTLKYENIAVTISKLIKYNKNPLFGGALYKILNFLFISNFLFNLLIIKFHYHKYYFLYINKLNEIITILVKD